ncbi:MAG: potassium channel family protein [Planctomycetaceae bacterium]
MPRFEGTHRLSVARFLVALALMLIITPFLGETRNSHLIEAVLITLVLLLGVMAVGGRRKTLITAAVLVTPAFIGTWVQRIWPGSLPVEITLTAAIIFVAFVAAHLLYFILWTPRVDSEVLCAAISTYLLLGLLGAFAYSLVALLVPDSFDFNPNVGANREMKGFDALFYSFGTLAPINYGDIVPVSNAARILTMVQATCGVFYVTMLVARLVALYAEDSRRQSDTPPDAI